LKIPNGKLIIRQVTFIYWGDIIMGDFMIGMYGKYDDKKFDRDFRKGFYGIEACLFEEEGDIERLCNKADKEGFKVGIHFPLRSGISKLFIKIFNINTLCRYMIYFYMILKF
jgi:hypothetical protein